MRGRVLTTFLSWGAETSGSATMHAGAFMSASTIRVTCEAAIVADEVGVTPVLGGVDRVICWGLGLSRQLGRVVRGEGGCWRVGHAGNRLLPI